MVQFDSLDLSHIYSPKTIYTKFEIHYLDAIHPENLLFDNHYTSSKLKFLINEIIILLFMLNEMLKWMIDLFYISKKCNKSCNNTYYYM